MIPAALLDPRTTWYVTRGTGMVSVVLLTASVVLGILEVVRWAAPKWPRFVTAGLHKNISLLAVSFVAAHVITAIVDGFAPIGWIDAVIPFHSPYRPLWLGLGTVAFDLLLALIVTSLVRRRIGQRAWRLVHWSAYACWPVALLHGVGTGTDTKTSWALGVELACLAAVVLATWWRIAAGWPVHRERRVAAAATSALAPLLIAAWAIAGPLQPGWARRAGTPDSLLTSTAGSTQDAVASEPPPSAPAPTALPSSFDAALSGSETNTGPDGQGNETITIDTQLGGGVSGALHLQLEGRARRGGGILLDSSTVTLQPAGGVTFTGEIGTLQGGELQAELRGADGSTLVIDASLSIEGTTVSGSVHGEQG